MILRRTAPAQRVLFVGEGNMTACNKPMSPLAESRLEQIMHRPTVVFGSENIIFSC